MIKQAQKEAQVTVFYEKKSNGFHKVQQLLSQERIGIKITASVQANDCFLGLLFFKSIAKSLVMSLYSVKLLF